MVKDLDREIRFGFLVHDVSRLRRIVVDRALKPLGITRSQWWVLSFLSRRDGMTQTAPRVRPRPDQGGGRRPDRPGWRPPAWCSGA